MKGNSFINSSSSAISERGCGIASFYSPINVSPSYLHIPYYHLDHHSTFEGLLYGIKAINFYSSEKHSITENDFTDCYHSIYLNNTSNTEILSNSFYIPVEDASINTPPYGIYLNGDYSFHIEDNEFAADYYPGTYGIIANELGAVNNELYRNHFVGLNYGIQPQQQNKGVIAGHRVGLKLFCNDFHNEKFDYDVLVLGKQIFDQLSYRHIGIADAQQIAVLNNPNQSYYPAGNEFSSQHEGGTFDFDNGQADYLVYFHENNTSLRFKPEYSVNIGLDNNLQVPENSCPSKLNGSGNIPTESALLTQAQLALNSSIVIRNIWKDGGNTNLENQVETTLPWDVYVEFNGLIAESPYLSDEVLMATINNPAFTSLMIKLIMVANPQASHNDEIMNAIYDRIPALPQSYIDAIRAGESTVSQLELLEANVSADYHLVRSIESNIIDIYRSDTINTNAYTNMLSFMTARPGLQDKYMLAATYLAHNDYTNMQSVLDAISTTFSLNNKETIEYQNSLTTFAIAKDIRQNDKHMGDLNETQMANLEAIVNQSGTNHAMALALLEWNNPEMELNELILHKPETNARKAAPDKQMDRPEIASVFKIYPNPAKDYFTLQYSNEIETMQNLSVIITDMQGRTIREEYFDNGTIYQLIDVLTLSAGLYSVSLYSGSLLLEVKQLNIVE
ncbi:MAG: hypothetical protein DRI86_12015 [Bacteroidetes bacterium]|nr:MAG: hypothetical protein DRI86_12015 [Bacteroidota bacterium]